MTIKHFYNLFVESTQKRLQKEPPPANVHLEKVIKK